MWEGRDYIEFNQYDEKEIRELLIGRKVKVDGDNLILDNGVILEIEANERLRRLLKWLVFNNKFK